MSCSQQEETKSHSDPLPSLGPIPSVPSVLIQHVVKVAFSIFILLVIFGFIIAFTVTMNKTVDGSGVLEPIAIIPVRSYQSGNIEHINISRGVIVSRGQPLVQLKSTATNKRVLNLILKHGTKTNNYQIARESHKSKQHYKLNQLTIVSPIRGIVLTQNPDLRIGSFINKEEDLLELGSLDGRMVILFLGEEAVHEISVGDSANIELKPSSGENVGLLQGNVASISSKPMNSESEVNRKYIGFYRVTVNLDSLSIISSIRSNLQLGYDIEGKIKTGPRRIIDFIWIKMKNNSFIL
jgi:multidrug resistance efflux pump